MNAIKFSPINDSSYFKSLQTKSYGYGSSSGFSYGSGSSSGFFKSSSYGSSGTTQSYYSPNIPNGFKGNCGLNSFATKS